MKSSVNQKAINSATKVLGNQIKALQSQGYEDIYFTAQFFSNGKKQNGIERGDVAKISKQVRDYVRSEEADAMSVEVFEESSGKSIYRKKFIHLLDGEESPQRREQPLNGFDGLTGYEGLGQAQVVQVNGLIERKVDEQRRNDELSRLNKEVDELRTKTATLETEKQELEASIKAKSDVEFYSGIIGAAFPGLAPLFTGTPLAQAAGFLSGTTDMQGNALPAANEPGDEEVSSISTMVSEFCNNLNTQEANAIHLLFMAFEADRSKIQSALHHITSMPA